MGESEERLSGLISIWERDGETFGGHAKSLEKAKHGQGEVADMAAMGLRNLQIKLPLASILWVDDHPLSNFWERRAFANLGIYTDSYTTNDDALEALNRAGADYHLIISDIRRDQSSETGLDLLKKVQERRLKIPFVFYIGERPSPSIPTGAFGITNRPDELVRLVADALEGPPRRLDKRLAELIRDLNRG